MKLILALSMAVGSLSIFAEMKMGSSCEALSREGKTKMKIINVGISNISTKTHAYVHFQGKESVHYVTFTEQDLAAGLAFNKGESASVVCVGQDQVQINKL